MFDGAKTTDVGEAMEIADATPRWKVIDRQLRTIAKRRGALDCDEAMLLCEASRHEVWRRVGNASLFEYVEEVLGYGPKTARERIRIATALDEMPELADALASGDLSYSAVRELTRVATPETEREWIDAARGKNLRQVEELVGKHRKATGRAIQKIRASRRASCRSRFDPRRSSCYGRSSASSPTSTAVSSKMTR